MDSALLPAELLEKIIFEAWSLPLSNDDRINLMTSFLLINSTWKELFTRVSFKDAHIPCPSYLTRYMVALAGYSSLVSDGQPPPHETCQSITIKIPPPIANIGILKDDDKHQENPMGETLSNLLYYLDGIIDAPNLRTLRIEYENMGFNDIFDCWRLAHFPVQITNLEVSFSSDKDASAPDDVLRVFHQRQETTLEEVEAEAYSLCHVKRLSVSGASDAFVADIMACCPNVQDVMIWCPANSSPPPAS